LRVAHLDVVPGLAKLITNRVRDLARAAMFAGYRDQNIHVCAFLSSYLTIPQRPADGKPPVSKRSTRMGRSAQDKMGQPRYAKRRRACDRVVQRRLGRCDARQATRRWVQR